MKGKYDLRKWITLNYYVYLVTTCSEFCALSVLFILLLISVEQEVPIDPPSATTTTTIGISATSATFTNVFGKKRANVVTTPSTNRKNKKNKTKETPPTAHLILPEQHIPLAQQKADKNKINGEPRGGGTGGNSDSDNLDSTDCNSESSSGGKSQEFNFTMDVNSSSDRRYPSLLLHSQEEKTSNATSKTQTR